MRRAFFILACLVVVTASASDRKPSKPKCIFSAVVHDTPIAIFISVRPFDPSLHKTTPYTSKENGMDPHPATVDGAEVIGSDGTLPPAGCPQLASLYVTFGKTRVDLPPRQRNRIFLPRVAFASFDQNYGTNIISVSADGKAVLISLGVGDTGWTTSHTFYIGADGTCSDQELHRPDAG